MNKKNKINKNAGNVEKGIEFFNNTISEEIIDEEILSKYGRENIIIPKRDADGTAILPASERENDYYDELTLDESNEFIWKNGVLQAEVDDDGALILPTSWDDEEEFTNESINKEYTTSSIYSVENARRLGIPLDDIEKEIFTEYGRALEELAK